MAISLSKSIPSSSWYSGTGSTTVTLAGATQIIVNSKKALIKIQIPQSSTTYEGTASTQIIVNSKKALIQTQILKGPGSWKESDTDKGVNQVTDLKKVEDQIKIRGWLIDTTASSAWSQAWKLRAMSTSGGPLSDLTIENLTFGTGSQEAFLEEVNFIAHPLTAKGLTINETSSDSIGVARIECDLSIYLGDER